MTLYCMHICRELFFGKQELRCCWSPWMFHLQVSTDWHYRVFATQCTVFLCGFFHSLQRINLSVNSLQSISDHLFQLESLRVVNLADNCLTALCPTADRDADTQARRRALTSGNKGCSSNIIKWSPCISVPLHHPSVCYTFLSGANNYLKSMDGFIFMSRL